jgi:hypothetical protein
MTRGGERHQQHADLLPPRRSTKERERDKGRGSSLTPTTTTTIYRTPHHALQFKDVAKLDEAAIDAAINGGGEANKQ